MGSGVTKIISGGQTGADQGGLAAAQQLRLETGGWMPSNWRTEDGALIAAAALGMKMHWSREYQPRTRLNVRDSDGTVWFGRAGSAGFQCTQVATATQGKEFHVFLDAAMFLVWLRLNRVQVLNVAGNRESTNPGIFERTRAALVEVLG